MVQKSKIHSRYIHNQKYHSFLRAHADRHSARRDEILLKKQQSRGLSRAIMPANIIGINVPGPWRIINPEMLGDFPSTAQIANL